MISNNNDNNNTLDDIKDNRVLLISENKQKVFLPYYVDDLKSILKDSDYENINQIIETEYVVPISKYNSSFISRFNEAYNLMRNKEKSSVKDALDLAIELTFNNLLNPAIITACRNLDELDIYLDYLRTNEVDKFKIFEIKYEYSPAKK